MRDEPWLQDALDMLLRGCGRQLAVDVGANHGTWSVLLKPLFRRVIAVEPDERCADITGVQFYRCALGRSAGTGTLHLAPRPEQNHFAGLHPLHHDEGRPVTVPVMSLDDVCAGAAPDFIKIDVEGAETEILQGVADPAAYLTTAFLIESHAQEAALVSILGRWGRPFRKIEHPDNCPDHCWLAVHALTE